MLTPRLNQKNIKSIGKKCERKLKIYKKIDYILDKNIKRSEVKVNKKGEEYTVYIKDNYLGHNTSEIIHELTHIKTGQSDRVMELPDNFWTRLLNLYFELSSAWPSEIRYFWWVKYQLQK